MTITEALRHFSGFSDEEQADIAYAKQILLDQYNDCKTTLDLITTPGSELEYTVPFCNELTQQLAKFFRQLKNEDPSVVPWNPQKHLAIDVGLLATNTITGIALACLGIFVPGAQIPALAGQGGVTAMTFFLGRIAHHHIDEKDKEKVKSAVEKVIAHKEFNRAYALALYRISVDLTFHLRGLLTNYDAKNQQMLARKWTRRYRHYAFKPQEQMLGLTTIPIFIRPSSTHVLRRRVTNQSGQSEKMHKIFALAPVQKISASYEAEQEEALDTEKYAQRIEQLSAISFLDGEIYHKHKTCVLSYHLAKQHQIEWKLVNQELEN